jgi:TM2 domain-containing membrane protein YozV
LEQIMADLQTHRTADFAGGDGKNMVIAYLLWWFLGLFGIHRFYLDRPKSGLCQLLLLAFGWLPIFIGWIILGIWWMLDAGCVLRLPIREGV